MPRYIKRATRSQYNLSSRKKLRRATPEEVNNWSDENSNATDDLTDLNDARPYSFKGGEAAWVRTAKGTWCFGIVIGTSSPRVGLTRDGTKGLFYPVIFTLPHHRPKMKKNFAPMNGEIKPDSKKIRDLLKSHGWL